MQLVRSWLFNTEPWPIHHEIGNIVSLHPTADRDRDAASTLFTEYITFNNPCFADSNGTNALILVFDHHFASWNIRLDCNDLVTPHHQSLKTVYSTFRADLNCADLPIYSDEAWQFQLFANTTEAGLDEKSSNTPPKYVYLTNNDCDRYSENYIALYVLVIIFMNACCGTITYFTYKHHRKRINSEVNHLQTKTAHHLNSSSALSDQREDSPLKKPKLPNALEVVPSNSQHMLQRSRSSGDERLPRIAIALKVPHKTASNHDCGEEEEQCLPAMQHQTTSNSELPTNASPFLVQNVSSNTHSDISSLPSLQRLNKTLSATPTPNANPVVPTAPSAMNLNIGYPCTQHTAAHTLHLPKKKSNFNMTVINDALELPQHLHTKPMNNCMAIHIDEYYDEHDDHNRDLSLPSLPSLPSHKYARNYSFSTNDNLNLQMPAAVARNHSRNDSHNLLTVHEHDIMDSKLSSIDTMSEHNTNGIFSELDDSILDEDFHDNLDNILQDIQQLDLNAAAATEAGPHRTINVLHQEAPQPVAEKQEGTEEEEQHSSSSASCSSSSESEDENDCRDDECASNTAHNLLEFVRCFESNQKAKNAARTSVMVNASGSVQSKRSNSSASPIPHSEYDAAVQVHPVYSRVNRHGKRKRKGRGKGKGKRTELKNNHSTTVLSPVSDEENSSEDSERERFRGHMHAISI